MDSMRCQYVQFMWNRSNNHAVLVRRDLMIGPSPETRTSVSLAAGLELVGLIGPTAVRTDVKAVAVDLYWKADKPIPSRLGLIARLVDKTGREVVKRTVSVGYDWYKTNEWQSGEVVRQRFALGGVPRRGSYQLELRVSDETGAAESSDPAIWPIRIDNPAASHFVGEQKTLAELALKQGAFEEALRRISVARSAQPQDQSLLAT